MLRSFAVHTQTWLRTLGIGHMRQLSTSPPVSIKDLLARDTKSHPLSDTVRASGWVRTVRGQKKIAFLTLNDGTTFHGLQCVFDNPSLVQNLATGASVEVTGKLVEHPAGAKAPPGQRYELHGTQVHVHGMSDGAAYPLQKKYHSPEYARQMLHLRPRTAAFASTLRVRNAATMGFHNFFQREGFLYVHTPVVTPLDCEGAGELFTVHAPGDPSPSTPASPSTSASSPSTSSSPTLSAASTHTPTTPSSSTSHSSPSGPSSSASGASGLSSGSSSSSSSSSFFGRAAYLTVSGQLYAEMCAGGIRSCYTFGPTFRAEHSHTTRHLAEFWMLEPEVAFNDLDANMDLAERSIKSSLEHVLTTCAEDMRSFDEKSPGLLDMLTAVSGSGSGSGGTSFARVTYSHAVHVLQQCGKRFVHPVQWGLALQSEHERYLAEEYCKKPVFVTHYPRAIKPFYMRRSTPAESGAPNGEPTVACMDLLVPGVGELIGGSQREERLDLLIANMKEAGLNLADYEWYLDLRRYGTVPHSGFGLGLERFLMYLTGVSNVRDLILVPRYAGSISI